MVLMQGHSSKFREDALLTVFLKIKNAISIKMGRYFVFPFVFPLYFILKGLLLDKF